MRHIISTPQFAVYDDALPAEDHKAAWRQLQHEDYSAVVPGVGVTRIDDGHALRSNKSYLWTDSLPSCLPPQEKWTPRLVPSAGRYDSLLVPIAEIAIKHEELVGTKHRDWVAIILTPHLYKRGDAVSWHMDSFSYSGAFAYYGHQYWNCLWGGELLIVDERTAADPRHFDRKSLLDNEEENDRLMKPGLGRFIFPKPNRLVFIGAGNQHMISKVHDAAGNNVRAVFAGFFLRTDAVHRILAS